MLEFRQIRKAYGAVEAVKAVDLAIREGEFFSLLGPSGCGKTTLLRMLGGFETPSSGEIHLNGRRIDRLPSHERPFNMVFQKYALFPHLNVRQNVAFGLQMKKVPAAEIANRVSTALAMVRMESFSDRAIGTLSGGQQQRIALARALINRPSVLLLDEPLSALDLKLRQQMQVELLGLQRKLKHTFIFVTHDQEEALTLSDRIAVMNGGVIEQIGTPQEIYEFPKTPFVARFIGTINELPSQAPGTQLMIRPEKLRVLKSKPGPEQPHVEGALKEILYQGAVTLYFVQPKDRPEQTLVASQPNTAVTARKAYSVGDRIFVAWAPTDCITMSAEAGLG